MRNKIILVFIGFFIFQVTTQNIFSKGTIMTTETCEETGDESNYQKDLKQDLKITNITALHNDNIWFSYHLSTPLYFQIKIISASHQSVETPPPNDHYFFNRVVLG